MDDRDLEARLATRLHARFDEAHPPHELWQGVADTLGRDSVEARRLRFMAVLAAAAVLLVTAVLAVSWLPSRLPIAATSPSPTASGGSSAAPNPSGHLMTVSVVLAPGHSLTVTVDDQSGLLVAARAATEAELVAPSVPAGGSPGALIAYNPGGRPSPEVRVFWLGTICDAAASLVIGEGAVAMWLYEAPRPTCDTMAVGRGIVLTFSRTIAAKGLGAKLVPAPTPTPSATQAVPSEPPAETTSTWTTVTLPTVSQPPVMPGLPGGGGMSALPGGGFIDFVPVAADRTVVFRSADGSHWVQTGTVTGLDALGITGPVAFDGHVYVALGGESGGFGNYAQQSNGAVWVSSDLRQWTKAPAQDAFGDAELSGIVARTAGFVAIGFDAGGQSVWASKDGLRWSVVSDPATFPIGAYPDSILRTPDGLLMVGRVEGAASVWTSTDGAHWTRHDMLSGLGVLFHGLAVGAGGYASLGISAGGAGVEVAPGDFRAPVVPLTSTDDVAWHAGAPSDALFGAYATLVAAPGGFVAAGAVGPDFRVWTSRDGLAWARVAGLDLSGAQDVRLASDGRHVVLEATTVSGLRVMVSDGVIH